MGQLVRYGAPAMDLASGSTPDTRTNVTLTSRPGGDCPPFGGLGVASDSPCETLSIWRRYTAPPTSPGRATTQQDAHPTHLDVRHSIAPCQGNTTQEAAMRHRIGRILCKCNAHWWGRCPDPTAWQCARCWKTIGRW